jgi:acylphosphatase
MTESRTENQDGTEVCRAYRVHGRVQGIGFRWWTRLAAERLGVRGRVWNLESRSVEVHAAGTLTALRSFERVFAKGPPVSRVTSVESIEPGDDLPAVGFHVDRVDRR